MNERERFDELSSQVERGDTTAASRLAECYELGLGVERDVVKAYELYERSATRGDMTARFNALRLFRAAHKS